MGGTGVIDRFLGVFTQYIDSGFGLLQPEVAFVATTLIAIDITLAALFWSISGLMGYISFFENFIQIMVLLFAWVMVLLAFFILAAAPRRLIAPAVHPVS